MKFDDLNKDFYTDNSIDRNPMQKDAGRFYPELNKQWEEAAAAVAKNLLPSPSGAAKGIIGYETGQKDQPAPSDKTKPVAEKGDDSEDDGDDAEKSYMDKCGMGKDFNRLAHANLALMSAYAGRR